MTFNVPRVLRRLVGVGFVAMLATSEARAASTAVCARPPGGSITCEDAQLAICKVVRGEVDGSCKTVPKAMKGDELKSWLLWEVKGERVSAPDLELPSNKVILQKMRFEKEGAVVTFKAPKPVEESSKGYLKN